RRTASSLGGGSVFQEGGEAGGDGLPGEVMRRGEAAAFGERGAAGSVREDTQKSGVELLPARGFVQIEGDENDAGFGDGRGCLRAGIGDDRKSAGDAGDGAGAAGRNRAADEEKRVAGRKPFDDLRSFQKPFHGEFYGEIAQAFAKGNFAEFGVTAEDGEAELSQFFGGEADGGEDFAGFAGAGFAAGDGEDGDGWGRAFLAAGFQVCRGKGWIAGGRYRQVWADGKESEFGETAAVRRNPRDFFREHREDREIGEIEGAAHSAKLGEAADAVNEAMAGERLDVVEDDGDAGVSGGENAERLKEAKRKAAFGPGESGVLHENPSVAPSGGLQLQRLERARPAVKFPGNAADFELETAGSEGFAEMSAIFLDGVGRLVAASKKSEDAAWVHWGSARTCVASQSRQR